MSEKMKTCPFCDNKEETTKDSWIYWENVLDPEQEKLIGQIERALGFELFIWQKIYIFNGIWRRYGKTTAEILRDLLMIDADPLDYTERPINPRQEFYMRETRKIQEKLRVAGINTRKVLWTKSDKEEWDRACDKFLDEFLEDEGAKKLWEQ